jgi:hypothetical protein
LVEEGIEGFEYQRLVLFLQGLTHFNFLAILDISVSISPGATAFTRMPRVLPLRVGTTVDGEVGSGDVGRLRAGDE